MNDERLIKAVTPKVDAQCHSVPLKHDTLQILHVDVNTLPVTATTLSLETASHLGTFLHSHC
jgi:hypothetical protein